MKGYLYRITLLMVLLSFNLSAQQTSISGYIKDGSSGETLIGATVLDKEKNVAVTSNEYGLYTIFIDEFPVTLTVMYIGFNTKEVVLEAAPEGKLDIELFEERNELTEVVLTGQGKNQNIRSLEVGVSEVSLQRVKESPSAVGIADLIKTLEFEPGVSAPREGANGFNVRGGGTDQNLILLDEAVLYNASHLLGFFSVVNNDAIKKGKLYKAGIPAEYGGRLSSVLDIRQKDGNKKQIKGKGGIGLIASQFLLEGPIIKDKSSFMIAGRRSYVDIFLPFAPQEQARDATLFFYDLNAKFDYILDEKNKFFLSSYLGRDTFGFGGLFGNSWGNVALNLRWSHQFTDKLFSRLVYVLSKYDYKLEIKPSGSEFEWISNILNNSIKYKFLYNLDNNNTFKWGADATLIDFEPGEIRPTTSNSRVKNQRLDQKHALSADYFVSHKWQVAENFGIEYGLRLSTFFRLGPEKIRLYENDKPNKWNGVRYVENCAGSCVEGKEQFKDYGNLEVISDFYGFEPRLLMNYTINDISSVKASYNRNYQYLHLISNSVSPTPLDIWLPSGPYVEPQMADQFSIGYFRNFELFEEEVNVSVETFYKKLENVVDYIDYARLQLNNYIETELLPAEGRAYGLEVSIKKNQGKLRGAINYTLSRSERRTNVEEGTGVSFNDWYLAPFNKTHDLSVQVSYDVTDKLTLSSNFVYYTGLPVNLPTQAYFFDNKLVLHYTGERNADVLEDYHRVDLSAVYTFDYDPEDDWFEQDVVLSVYNVYNRFNLASLQFRQMTGQLNSAGIQAEKLAFFGIIPTVTWNFKF